MIRFYINYQIKVKKAHQISLDMVGTARENYLGEHCTIWFVPSFWQ